MRKKPVLAQWRRHKRSTYLNFRFRLSQSRAIASTFSLHLLIASSSCWVTKSPARCSSCFVTDTGTFGMAWSDLSLLLALSLCLVRERNFSLRLVKTVVAVVNDMMEEVKLQDADLIQFAWVYIYIYIVSLYKPGQTHLDWRPGAERVESSLIVVVFVRSQSVPRRRQTPLDPMTTNTIYRSSAATKQCYWLPDCVYLQLERADRNHLYKNDRMGAFPLKGNLYMNRLTPSIPTIRVSMKVPKKRMETHHVLEATFSRRRPSLSHPQPLHHHPCHQTRL